MSESFDALTFGDNRQTPSRVVLFNQLDYQANHSEDGGIIRRMFYVQPFTAHKSLLIALRGTFVPDGNNGLKRFTPTTTRCIPTSIASIPKSFPWTKKPRRAALTAGSRPTAIIRRKRI